MYPKGAAAKMVSFEGSTFGLPPSFPQLLFDFAKEVIRSQPEDIYQFGKEYFNCKRMGLPIKQPEGGYAITAVKKFEA